MFCPVCKAEYRPGFTHCNDCDVDLVDALPEHAAASAEPLTEADLPSNWRSAWAGSDEGECAAIGDRFDELDIPFRIVEQPEDFFFGGAGRRLEIRVPPESLAQARQIAREIDEQIVEENSGQDAVGEDLLDLDEDDDGRPSSGSAADQDGYWDPRNWIPEDATEGIWSGSDLPLAGMIEMSLREHRIHSRTDTLDDGSRQIFVMPEQQRRAREIVRQIVEGTPRT